MSRGRAAVAVLAVAAVVAAMWAIGFDGVNIALAAAATAVVAAVVGHRDLGREHGLPQLPAEQRAGHRHEVSQLSWSLTDRDGRVGERGLRQLREVAAGRLALAGIDPADDDAVRAHLGDRAWRTLRATTPQPVRALDACLTALENRSPRA
ncbi:hypothetical protein SAMN05216184_104240 [Georgenia satyanarayanai]|uniref:Uncharacterized protein n=1 Tax=Georgenia satyanarayanai TaxID=860221 RepID=A0A2Y9A869_9MICO|nr:hypothetical protein [Georgenia satyanarayanai]PYG00298.1 hypothetical protein A8987_104240 [Georgenia satyanarayanai]SSA40684.1 hypothetical protein SAMN05216184_104240 [Georgenia satyanarayanai]